MFEDAKNNISQESQTENDGRFYCYVIFDPRPHKNLEVLYVGKGSVELFLIRRRQESNGRTSPN